MKTKKNRPSAATLRRRTEAGAYGWHTPSIFYLSTAVDRRQPGVNGGVG